MSVKRWEFNPYQRETADGEYVEFTHYGDLLRLKDELLLAAKEIRFLTGELDIEGELEDRFDEAEQLLDSAIEKAEVFNASH